jgi:hypothetical protein
MSMFSFNKKKFDLAKAYQLAEQGIENIPFVERRLWRAKAAKIALKISYVIITLFLIFLAFAIYYALAIRKTYNYAMAGKDNIENSLFFIKEKKFSDAGTYAKDARQDFSSAYAEFQKVKSAVLISQIPIIKAQLQNLNYLLYSADLLSSAVYRSVGVTDKLSGFLTSNNANYSQFSRGEKIEFLDYIYKSSGDLIDLKRDLDEAQKNLDKVRFPDWFEPLNAKVISVRENVRQARYYVTRAIPASKILPEIFGYPEKKNFLFLLQNNNELRPTGGFIGTYGIMQTDAGDITRFDTHDIYHIDMPIKDQLKVAPPSPLKQYLGVPNWYLRDSNWSPDFPSAARQALWFYQQENRLQAKPDAINSFDGVLAFTPQFITDLLAMTGPIKIGKETYTKDNFTDLLEYRVEKGYEKLGISKWQRKEVIGEISKVLKQRIFDLDSDSWPQMAYLINKNIAEKNVLVFFNNQDLQNLAQAEEMAGELRSFDGDYLMVVDSNMASLKTDAAINRQLSYTAQVAKDGVYALLNISYAHRGLMDYKTTRYRTYARIYVPAGSKLIKVSGQTEGEVLTKSEYGKTAFELFTTVEPGHISALTLLYKLPEKIKKQTDNGTYSLLVQKQPGVLNAGLTVDFQMGRAINAYSPTGFNIERSAVNTVKWSDDFLTDKLYIVQTSK